MPLPFGGAKFNSSLMKNFTLDDIAPAPTSSPELLPAPSFFGYAERAIAMLSSNEHAESAE